MSLTTTTPMCYLIAYAFASDTIAITSTVLCTAMSAYPTVTRAIKVYNNARLYAIKRKINR